jgi:hypothetical protein
MIFIIIWQPLKNSQAILAINVNKFDTAHSVIEHTNYVQRLIIADQKKGKTGQLLNGYIEFHNKTCLQATCPLKKVRFQSINLLMIKQMQREK